MVSWGVQDSYEVVRKVGRGKVSVRRFEGKGKQKGASTEERCGGHRGMARGKHRGATYEDF